MEKMAWDGPKWGQEGMLPTNSDLADVLGRTDLRIFISLIFWIPNFWISRSPDFQNMARAGLGPGRAGLEPGRAGLEPSGPKNVDFLL